MPLSDQSRSVLFAPFAVSSIMQRCWLPGLAGMLAFAIGVWKNAGWLKVIGILLAAPIIWVYAVVIFVFLPFAVFDSIRRKMK